MTLVINRPPHEKWDNSSGAADYLHLVGQGGSIIGGIDSAGVAQGALAGGLLAVTSLPATCIPGTTSPVNLSVNGIGYGIFYCSATNVWTPADPHQSISPFAYGAKWDVKYVTDATWGNGVSVVTCPNNDCNFTSADIGKIMFGVQGLASVNGPCSGTNCGQLLVPQGVILSLNNTNSVNVSTVSIGSCTVFSGQMCAFAWGTQDDTTAINAASQAAWNNGTSCRALIFPSGNAFFSGQILNVTSSTGGNPCANTNANGSQADAIQVGALVMGQGMGVTTLIPLPNFTFTNPIVGGTPQAQYHDFGINGLGQARSGETHAVSIFQTVSVTPACTGTTAFNIGIYNWLHQSTSSIGFDVTGACGDPMIWNVISEMAGETTCRLSPSGGQPMVVLGLACFGSNGGSGSLFINGGGILTTIGGYFEGVMGGGIAVQVVGAGTWNSYGDNISTQFAQTAQAIPLYIPASGGMTVNLNGDSISTASTNTNPSSTLVLINGSGTTLRIQNTTLGGAGANNRTLQLNAGNTFFDQGGNTWSLGGQASAIVSGSLIADGHSIKGGCTGVATAASTLGLYGTGPNVTLSTCTSTTIGTGLIVSGPRTLMGLQALAATGGVNVSSGVVTVLKNGVATALTCTIGTGTVCNDFVHSVALADGDLVSIQFTTQTAETLAGVKAVAWWN